MNCTIILNPKRRGSEVTVDKIDGFRDGNLQSSLDKIDTMIVGASQICPRKR